MMQKKQITPMLSVIMSVFNGAKYLYETVDSILCQTCSDFEFIIIDDGSTDQSYIILKNYAKKDNRIILVRNENNIGLTSSLNHGLSMARGEYIARMDADDFSLPGRLEAQVAYLHANPEIGVLSVAARLIDSFGVLGHEIIFPADHTMLQWRMCFFENPIIHPGVMFRKKLVLAVGGYSEDFPAAEDYHLWYQLSVSTKLANLQEVFLYLRKHTANISSMFKEEQKHNTLKISALMISSVINEQVNINEMTNYRDFLWEKRELSRGNIIYASKIIYRIAKKMLRNLEIKNNVRMCIIGDAVRKISNLMESDEICFFDILKLKYLVLVLRINKIIVRNLRNMG